MRKALPHLTARQAPSVVPAPEYLTSNATTAGDKNEDQTPMEPAETPPEPPSKLPADCQKTVETELDGPTPTDLQRSPAASVR